MLDVQHQLVILHLTLQSDLLGSEARCRLAERVEALTLRGRPVAVPRKERERGYSEREIGMDNLPRESEAEGRVLRARRSLA